MGRFNKGLLFGGILGAGLMWMNVTKRGRELRDQIFDHAAAVYAEVREKVMAHPAWKNMTESEFAEEVKRTLDAYAKKTGMAGQVRDGVERVVRTQWKKLRKEE